MREDGNLVLLVFGASLQTNSTCLSEISGNQNKLQQKFRRIKEKSGNRLIFHQPGFAPYQATSTLETTSRDVTRSLGNKIHAEFMPPK